MSTPRRRATASPTPGLYRRRLRGKGPRSHEVGAYILDIRIKDVPEFAGITPKRIAKSTEVFPGERDAERKVEEMKMMVKELIHERDHDTLRKIQAGDLTLASAYTSWKSGRLHLAYGFQGEPLLKLWREHYEKSPVSEITRKSRKATLNALVTHGLITDQHVVNELPDLLARIRDHYQQTKRHVQFNNVRVEALAFAKRKLKVDITSPFVQALRKSEPLKLINRREHHPFENPREYVAFCRAIDSRFAPTRVKRAYMSSALFMCLHGLRPDEFARQSFEIDAHTGHLRIKGTKNENAKRIVPLVAKLEVGEIPPLQMMNRTFQNMGSPVRCRDFRRTYAVWCEKAGVSHSRLRTYMGHGETTMTGLYQRSRPTRQSLDEDSVLLAKWFDEEMKKPEKQDAKAKPLAASTIFGKPFPTQLADVVRTMNAEQAAIARSRRPEEEGEEGDDDE